MGEFKTGETILFNDFKLKLTPPCLGRFKMGWNRKCKRAEKKNHPEYSNSISIHYFLSPLHRCQQGEVLQDCHSTYKGLHLKKKKKKDKTLKLWVEQNITHVLTLNAVTMIQTLTCRDVENGIRLACV